jgi:hypothetical protein
MRGLKDLTNERVKDLANKRTRRAATKVFSRGTKHLLELRSSRHYWLLCEIQSRTHQNVLQWNSFGWFHCEVLKKHLTCLSGVVFRPHPSTHKERLLLISKVIFRSCLQSVSSKPSGLDCMLVLRLFDGLFERTSILWLAGCYLEPFLHFSLYFLCEVVLRTRLQIPSEANRASITRRPFQSLQVLPHWLPLALTLFT